MSPWESDTEKAYRKLWAWIDEHVAGLDDEEDAELMALIDDLRDAACDAGYDAGRPD